jgi:hypothetical protein
VTAVAGRLTIDDRLKSRGAIPRREFAPRDPYCANQRWRCRPRWQASDLDVLTGRNPCERVKFLGADFAGQGVYARAERGQSQHWF